MFNPLKCQKHNQKNAIPIPNWDISSLIDLEFLHETRQTDVESNKRNRQIYQEKRTGLRLDPSIQTKPGDILRIWVEAYRETKRVHELSPGQNVAKKVAEFRFWGCFIGIFAGILLAWGALNISDKQINVSLFWILTIGLPLTITSIGCYLLFTKYNVRSSCNGGFLIEWIKSKILNMAADSMRLVNRQASQENLAQINKFAGLIKRRSYGRSPEMTAEVHSLAHQLGLGVMGGIVIAIASFRLFSYQDYGWQTHTACLTPEKTHSIVMAIAVPWDGFTGDGIGYPSLDQIRNTRIFRNSPSSVANPSASIAWSSFLFWSSFVYGFLPRLLLLFFGRVVLRRTYETIDFSKFDSLLRCLNNRDVIIHFPDGELPYSPHDVTLKGNDLPSQRTNRDPDHRLPATSGTALLLAPKEFNTLQELGRIRPEIDGQDLGFDEVQLLPSLPTERSKWLGSFVASSTPRLSRILILQDSFKPPNQSFERFLREIRSKFGGRLPIHVVLVHKKSHPNAANHLVAWRSRLDPIMGDPLISLHVL